MPFDPSIAAIRFGTGLGPRIVPPSSAAAMIDRLAGPDATAQALPIQPFAEAWRLFRDYRLTARDMRQAGSEAERDALEVERDRLREALEAARLAQARTRIARVAVAEDGLRERLVLFWANHFAVERKVPVGGLLIAPYIEEAIRPHVAGRFADMLEAVTLHPKMLIYLDQARSVGPGSPVGRRSERGLNENLARELLELHTVGIGPYSQEDVTELAKLLTGLTVNEEEGATAFRPAWAEPGAETVLGESYGPRPGLEPIRAVLRDLAARPETAAHLARKLAVHFVSDMPDGDLVAALEATFRSTGGDLLAVTEVLVAHPAAWERRKQKVKTPLEFVGSALRALGVGSERLLMLDDRDTRRLLLNPLQVMGQPWDQPGSPQGWPEAAEAWVTPQFVAARIDWAMTMPERLLPDLPDPRRLVEDALGPQAAEEVRFAAGAAERLSEGVGVVLASADFQRR
ncbi:DUF1800 family protein [Rubellimicrobium sp. CFH 75288]|uniref:DUF1800 domain-containing protein n=1 Tax=Rubellimicrobium sp. CFH 75288 TaxID=2697034 RepID=UPI003529EC16